MKILFYRYGSICEPDILETFMEYGFEVTEVTKEIYNKNLTLEEQVAHVSEVLIDKPQDAIFSINFFPFLSEICNRIKLRYLCWIVDSPVLELYFPAVKYSYNRIFIFDRTLYQEIAPMNPECVFYLPLAVNIRQKQSVIESANGKVCNKFTSDISFVGSLYTEKCPYKDFINPPDRLRGYLEGLMEAQLLVYGYYFIDDVLKSEDVEGFLKYTKNCPVLPYETSITNKILVSQYYLGTRITVLERQRMLEALSERFEVDLYTGSDVSLLPKIHLKGLANTEKEMPVIFNQSRINLNMSAKSIRSGIPLRIWDILGCGGFCMTNYQSEVPEYFSIGEEIEIYSSKEELMDKCQFYLEHESRRREIAYNAFEKVQKQHTYFIRLAQLIEVAFAAASDK